MDSKKIAVLDTGTSVEDGNDQHLECVPHEKVQETIAKIQALKDASADVPSFLPAWADDKYFQSLHEERKTDKYSFGTIIQGTCNMQYRSMHRIEDHMESKIVGKETIHIQDIDKQRVDAFVHEIIGKAYRQLHKEGIFLQMQNAVVEKLRTCSLQTEDIKSTDQCAKHKLLMNKVLVELTEQTQRNAKMLRDSILNPITDKDFATRTTFLTQSFEHLCDQLTCVQQETNRKRPESARPRLPQYTFLHTAGIPSATESNRAIHKQRPSWKRRILGCLGLNQH